MAEIWKPVNGYEGLYEVSNLGRVRSLPRDVAQKNGRVVHYRGRVLKSALNSHGYERVPLSDLSGHKKRLFVHRLVAAAFLQPGAGDVVNHKDFDPRNNCVSNLEYTTLYGNYKYSEIRGRFKRTDQWRQHLATTLRRKFGKSIVGTNIVTGEEIRFPALNMCRDMGFQPSCVSNCCQGKRDTHAGYTWRYGK